MIKVCQTKFADLTIELDLKKKEYKKLCDKLDELKARKIDPNDDRLLDVKELFQKNHDDIVKINKQIREIKEKEKQEQYNPENIFNKKNNNSGKQEEKKYISVVESKKSFLIRFIEKIKDYFI